MTSSDREPAEEAGEVPDDEGEGDDNCEAGDGGGTPSEDGRWGSGRDELGDDASGAAESAGRGESPPPAGPAGRSWPFPFAGRTNFARFARLWRRSSATRRISAIPASSNRTACSHNSFGASSRCSTRARTRRISSAFHSVAVAS